MHDINLINLCLEFKFLMRIIAFYIANIIQMNNSKDKTSYFPIKLFQ